jgi:hypothetical protein
MRALHALRRRGIPGWGVFIDKEKQGGGPLIDIGVHILDTTLWLMGYPKPVAAFGATYTKFGNRPDVVGLMGQWDYTKFTVEDFAVGLIRLENGATITLESSFCANIERDEFNTLLLGDRAACSPTRSATAPCASRPNRTARCIMWSLQIFPMSTRIRQMWKRLWTRFFTTSLCLCLASMGTT